MRLASMDGGGVKRECSRIEKTPVNRGVSGILTRSKRGQNETDLQIQTQSPSISCFVSSWHLSSYSARRVMRMASTNAGEFKNLCVEMQKTPVNRDVLSLLNGSKQVQNGLPVAFPIVTGFFSDHLPVIGIQEIAGHPEQRAPLNPGPPMSRRKPLPTTHRLRTGLTSPIRPGSTPLHSSAAR